MTARYFVRRVLQMVPVALGVVAITFFVSHLLGDPAQALAPEDATPAQVQLLRVQLGLDRPVLEQFIGYVGGLAQGDLGTSFAQHRPVTSLIGPRLGSTLLLMVTALALSTPTGIVLGALAARRPSGAIDVTVRTVALVVYAIPGFWLAQLAVLLLVSNAGLLPLSGMTSAGASFSGLDHYVDVARHLVLPATVLAASEVALLLRVTRAGILQQLGRDYVRTARAKGVGASEVVSRHALPNALLPVVTVIGSRIGFFFSGAVVIESVFAWPGLGSLLVESAQAHDEPVVLAMVLLASGSVMVANLLTDLTYGKIDPRIRYQ